MKKGFFVILAMLACNQAGISQVNPSVSPEDFSARQVHLDFHTSEQLPGIGKRFDKSKWQAALIRAWGEFGGFKYPEARTGGDPYSE